MGFGLYQFSSLFAFVCTSKKIPIRKNEDFLKTNPNFNTNAPPF